MKSPTGSYSEGGVSAPDWETVVLIQTCGTPAALAGDRLLLLPACIPAPFAALRRREMHHGCWRGGTHRDSFRDVKNNNNI